MGRIENINDESGFKVPVGRYVFVDPCYIFPSSEWDEMCDHIFGAGGGGSFEYDGVRVIWNGTAHGDGRYQYTGPGAEKDGDIPVDAGLICLVPWDFFVEMNEQKDSMTDCFHAFTLTEETRIRLDGGDWRMDSDVVVNTSGDMDGGRFNIDDEDGVPEDLDDELDEELPEDDEFEDDISESD